MIISKITFTTKSSTSHKNSLSFQDPRIKTTRADVFSLSFPSWSSVRNGSGERTTFRRDVFMVSIFVLKRERKKERKEEGWVKEEGKKERETEREWINYANLWFQHLVLYTFPSTYTNWKFSLCCFFFPMTINFCKSLNIWNLNKCFFLGEDEMV